MTTDPKLIQKYDDIYKDEKDFFTFIPMDERRSILGTIEDWEAFEVLEIGCGTGDLAAMIAAAGAKRVDAIDMSLTAIGKATNKYQLDNLNFIKGDFRTFRQENKSITLMDYDIVIMVGVLEHLEDPYAGLLFIMQHILRAGGVALVTCPNFINPRGYIWMALQELCGWPMSLTDKHQIHPRDMVEFATQHVYGCNVVSLDGSWAMGPRLLQDFRRRLVAASPETAEIAKERAEKFLAWLEKTLQYEQGHTYSGANILYQMGRPQDATAIPPNKSIH